ncbi:nitronate monooxygenase [Mycobacterium sp. B14F4]
MAAVFDPRSLAVPIVQAGMGMVAGHELAAAVSEAGGLGTVAGARTSIAARDSRRAPAHRTGDRRQSAAAVRPTRRVEAAAAADVIVTFWGVPRRLAAGTWIHQCGSVEEGGCRDRPRRGGRRSRPWDHWRARVARADSLRREDSGSACRRHRRRPGCADRARCGRRRGRRRHPLSGQRRKPRPRRIHTALRRRGRNRPHRVVRTGLAQRTPPGHSPTPQPAAGWGTRTGVPAGFGRPTKPSTASLRRCRPQRRTGCSKPNRHGYRSSYPNRRRRTDPRASLTGDPSTQARTSVASPTFARPESRYPCRTSRRLSMRAGA